MRITAKGSILFLFLFFGNGLVYAQKTVGFGIKYGFSSSTFYTSSEDLTDIDGRRGLLIGAFANIRVAEVIDFQPGIAYSWRGATVTITQTDDEGEEFPVTAEWKTSYIEVPLLFNVTFPFETVFKPHIVFGPSLNFLTTREVIPDNTLIRDNSETIQSFDLATVFGFGASYDWTHPGEIFFDIRYMLGTTNIHEYFDVSLKNAGLSLNIGYKF